MTAYEVGFSSDYFPELEQFEGHRHNDIEINFLMSGRISYAFVGNEVPVSTFQLAIFWAAIPHRLIEVAPSTQLYWVTIPLSYFMSWDLPNSMTRLILSGEFILNPDKDLVDMDRILIPKWYKDISRGHNKHKIVLLEIEARLRRLATCFDNTQTISNQPDYLRPVGSDSPAYEIVRYITQHYAEPLNGRIIANAVGIHPAYASRIFSETFSIGIIDYLTQYRISVAQKLLLTTSMNVQHIGFEVGFGSSSRFYAAFKKLCGIPPKKYRTQLLQFKKHSNHSAINIIEK